MTVSVNLPDDLEQRLMTEVRSGRHASLEEAILEKISRDEESDLQAITGEPASWLRSDLEAAWTQRDGAMDGEAFFSRLKARSDSLRSKGK